MGTMTWKHARGDRHEGRDVETGMRRHVCGDRDMATGMWKQEHGDRDVMNRAVEICA